MNSILDAILMVSLIAHIILAGYLLFTRGPTRHRPTWLLVAFVWSALVSGLRFVPDTLVAQLPVSVGYAMVLLLTLMIGAFGQYLLHDVLRRRVRFWLPLVLLWFIAQIAVIFAFDNVIVGQADWLLLLFTQPDLPGLVTLGGLATSTTLLIGLAFYGFYVAALPEVANRALYWVLNIALMSVGVLLSASGTDVFRAVGALVVLVALTGAVYAHVSYRVADIRSGLTAAVRTGLLVAFASGVVFVALLVADSLNIEARNEQILVLFVLAVLTASFYVVVRQVVSLILRPFLSRTTSPTQATRQYSQQVSQALELSELIEVATGTLNKVLNVRRSGMILVNDTGRDPQRVEVVVMKETSREQGSELKGMIAKAGPVYERLAVKKLPLAQFDIEFDPHYRVLEEAEATFFHGLNMSAYAPIVVENVLIGILMCGPRLNDAPFTHRELELLATMADQTGVALRNSRAMADLKHLNRTMRALNEDLEAANKQFEKLDSVKTDFITIASHELRTPLAQIRGYTDILDALNEQGMLDQDQIAGTVSNLRKATERTEELISAMLDMSQLDVNAMDLRFAQATPESILRMAIEPLTEHIKQRKLTLSARGLRGLPVIHCDMQRLVQAFRNILTNSIKFTPDGGRIDITASHQASDSDDSDHILVAISDTGVGIDSENLELIFEKFYRAYDPGLHSTGAYKFMGAGPGLGLTIAKGVIESHGGKIWAESSGHNMETYPGSTFYVILPVNPPEQARRVLIEEPGTLVGEVMA